jgi:hypothetical protein
MLIAIYGSFPEPENEPQGTRDEFQNTCYALGKTCAQNSYGVVITSIKESTADFHILRGFLDEWKSKAIKSSPTEEDRALLVLRDATREKFYNILNENPEFCYVADSYGDVRLEAHLLGLRRCDAVIAIGGNDHTGAAIRQSRFVFGKPTFPLGTFGGTARKALANAIKEDASLNWLLSFDSQHANKLLDQIVATNRRHCLVKIDPASIRDYFHINLPALQQWIKNFQPAPNESDAVVEKIKLFNRDDLIETRVAQEWAKEGAYFEYPHREGIFRFSEKYCHAWGSHLAHRKVSDIQSLTVFYVFMLHEFLHITTQGLSSYHYQFTDRAKLPLLEVDYYADAFSALAIHLLYKKFFPPAWRQLEWKHDLADIIKAVIVGIEVFTAMANPYPQKKLRWDGFARYLTWHFQYARVRQFSSDEGARLNLKLLQHVKVILGGIDPYVDRRLFTEKTKWPLEHRNEMLVCFDNSFYQFHSAENKNFAPQLAKAVLEGNLEVSNTLLGEFFEKNPSFIGRPPRP